MDIPGAPQTDQNPDPSVGLHPETVQQPPMDTGESSFQSGEQNQSIAPTAGGVFREKLNQASLESPIGFMPGYEGALVRQYVQSSLESELDAQNRTKISADEANKRYPGLPKPFDAPIYPEVADLIAQTHQERQDSLAWIKRGPESGKGLDVLTGAAAGGAAGILAGPVGIAMGAIGGGAFGGIFGGESVVAGVADPFNLALTVATGGAAKALGVAPTLGNSLIQNVGINALLTGSTVPQKLKERQDVTVSGELAGIAAGALAGTAIHGLLYGKYLPGAWRGAQRFTENMTPAEKSRNLQAALLQHESGADIDMTPAVQEFEMKASGAARPGTPENPYEFKPIDHPSEKTFYAAYSVGDGARVEFTDLGPGLHAVDDPGVANNLGRSFTEVQIPEDAKLLDMDQPLPKEIADQAALELKNQDQPAPSNLESMRASEVLDLLKDTSGHEAIRARIEGEGYDGYKYVAQGDSPHNGVVLFDPTKAATGEQFQSNKDIIPEMTGDQAMAASERAQSPEQSSLYEPGIDRKIEQMKAEPPVGSDPAALDPFMAEQMGLAKQKLKAAAEVDPALLEDPQYKEFLHQEAQDRQEAQILQDFADCMGRNF